ncbi:hypothetical protein JKG47_07515 [Acidithiobacillus sp. MC6.1]|nr:hypothetical protein [Acidithiobacillus sp. MC6.1]
MPGAIHAAFAGMGLRNIAQTHAVMAERLERKQWHGILPANPQHIDNLLIARETTHTVERMYRYEFLSSRVSPPPSLVATIMEVADTPGRMADFGVPTLVALNAQISPENRLGIARERYRYQDLPQPDFLMNDKLYDPANQAYAKIKRFLALLQIANIDVVVGSVLKDAAGFPDPVAYFRQKAKESLRIDTFLANVHKQAPEVIAGIYVIGHYLAESSSVDKQREGFTRLDADLKELQASTCRIPAMGDSSQSIGEIFKSVRAQFPVSRVPTLQQEVAATNDDSKIPTPVRPRRSP